MLTLEIITVLLAVPPNLRNCLRRINTKLESYRSRHTRPRCEDIVEEFIVLPSLVERTNLQFSRQWLGEEKTQLRLSGAIPAG